MSTPHPPAPSLRAAALLLPLLLALPGAAGAAPTTEERALALVLDGRAAEAVRLLEAAAEETDDPLLRRAAAALALQTPDGSGDPAFLYGALAAGLSPGDRTDQLLALAERFPGDGPWCGELARLLVDPGAADDVATGYARVCPSDESPEGGLLRARATDQPFLALLPVPGGIDVLASGGDAIAVAESEVDPEALFRASEGHPLDVALDAFLVTPDRAWGVPLAGDRAQRSRVQPRGRGTVFALTVRVGDLRAVAAGDPLAAGTWAGARATLQVQLAGAIREARVLQPGGPLALEAPAGVALGWSQLAALPETALPVDGPFAPEPMHRLAAGPWSGGPPRRVVRPRRSPAGERFGPPRRRPGPVLRAIGPDEPRRALRPGASRSLTPGRGSPRGASPSLPPSWRHWARTGPVPPRCRWSWAGPARRSAGGRRPSPATTHPPCRKPPLARTGCAARTSRSPPSTS